MRLVSPQTDHTVRHLHRKLRQACTYLNYIGTAKGFMTLVSLSVFRPETDDLKLKPKLTKLLHQQ